MKPTYGQTKVFCSQQTHFMNSDIQSDRTESPKRDKIDK